MQLKRIPGSRATVEPPLLLKPISAGMPPPASTIWNATDENATAYYNMKCQPIQLTGMPLNRRCNQWKYHCTTSRNTVHTTQHKGMLRFTFLHKQTLCSPLACADFWQFIQLVCPAFYTNQIGQGVLVVVAGVVVGISIQCRPSVSGLRWFQLRYGSISQNRWIFGKVWRI